MGLSYYKTAHDSLSVLYNWGCAILSSTLKWISFFSQFEIQYEFILCLLFSSIVLCNVILHWTVTSNGNKFILQGQDYVTLVFRSWNHPESWFWHPWFWYSCLPRKLYQYNIADVANGFNGYHFWKFWRFIWTQLAVKWRVERPFY